MWFLIVDLLGLIQSYGGEERPNFNLNQKMSRWRYALEHLQKLLRC